MPIIRQALSFVSRATALILLLAILLPTTGCPGNGTAVDADPTAFQRVNASGLLRVGYIPYPPNFIKDPNTGEMSGIAHDVLIRVAENLDWKVEFVEEVGWGSMIEAVKTARVDIIGTGIWPTASRGKSADFSQPIFYSTVRAYASADKAELYSTDPLKINQSDTRIAVVDGEMAAIIANSDYPQAQTVALTQMSDVGQLLLEVSSGKADITFVEPAIALEFIAKNPGAIVELRSLGSVRVFPNAYLLGKGESELQSTLNIAINELFLSGEIGKIISRYEKYPGSFARVGSPLSTDSNAK